MSSSTQDPRSNNVWFNTSSLKEYFTDYKKNLAIAVESVDSGEMDKAYAVMKRISDGGGTFFVCGNGGSNAVADHLCCDWTKGTYTEKTQTLRTMSLNANGPLFTAAAKLRGSPARY